MPILDTLGHPRILVLGDLILDRYTFGNAERVSPEAPVVVLRVDSKEVRLGGAASVAMLLRGLEADVTLAGVGGDDSEGRTLLKLLDEERIDRSMVLVDATRPTTTKERIIGHATNRHSHQIVRVDHETREPICSAIEEGLLGGIIRLLRSKPDPLGRFPTCQADSWGRFPTCQAPPTAEGRSPNCGAGVPPAAVQPGRPHHNSSDVQPLAGAPPEDRTAPADSRPPLAVENPSFDAILIADYAKGVCTPTLLRRAIDLGRAYLIPVIVDPARISDYSRYAGATLLKPNRLEAELAIGLTIESPEQALIAAAKLRDQHNLESVLVTLDRDGMAIVSDAKVAGTLRVPSSANGVCGPRSPHSVHLPTTPREVYDITGAGDMVLATLGLCLAASVPLPHAAQLANIAAGLQVEKLGVSAVTRAELANAAIRSDVNSEFGIRSSELEISASPAIPHSEFPTPNSPKFISLPEAVSLAATYRSLGKTLVFTNGCFDLLHVGHVACLEQAAALGGILIVAINSDVGVRRLKGPGRPVIPEQHRAALLAAMGCVDHVLIFDEPTPRALLEQIRPDILAKGGTTPEIIGREIVESYGGRALRVGEIPGISTTSLLSSLPAGVPPLGGPSLPPLARRGRGASRGLDTDSQPTFNARLERDEAIATGRFNP